MKRKVEEGIREIQHEKGTTSQLAAQRMEEGGYEPRNAVASRNRNGPQLTASKKTETLVLQPQELNYANHSNKQGTESPLKTPKETQLNDALILF